MLFAHKNANSAPEDVNAGAASLRYEEVRPRSSPSDGFKQSTTLQFDFSAAGRHILLSESYFEIRYRVGRSPHEAGADATANAPTAMPASGLFGGTGADNQGGMDIGLRARWFNNCISNVRHTINGSQIGSNNEPAATSWLNDSCTQSQGYNMKTGSAFFSNLSVTDRQKLLSASVNQECVYSPPLGIWSSHVAIPGSTQHSVQFDVLSHASYNKRIFEANLATPTNALEDEQFIHFDDYVNTIPAAKARFYSAIDSVVLRLATVSAQDMHIAPENMVIECREIEAQRIGAGANSSLTRQITMPGSLYKVSAHYVGSDTNSPVDGYGEPENPDTTGTTQLSLTVDGQLLQSPEYSLRSGAINIRPYVDMLVANGQKDAQEGSSQLSITNWTAKPFYMARVVQPPTSNKEVLLRSTHSQATSTKTAVVAAWYTKRILLQFDGEGKCVGVSVNA